MSLPATWLAIAALLAPTAIVWGHALPDAGGAASGTLSNSEFKTRCPHSIDRLATASEVAGVWYAQEIVKDTNITGFPCIVATFTADGENLQALSYLVGENEIPRNDSFPHTSDGLWEDSVSPVRGKVLLGFTETGLLVWCGRHETEPIVHGSVLWSRELAPSSDIDSLVSEAHRGDRKRSNCPSKAAAGASTATNEA